ncbi:MAG: quaternary amine ABC transporter ATP-binding protein [Devosia sp.]
MSPVIDIKEVTKIFGRNPERALAMLREGRGKQEIQAETGNVIGLDRVSLGVEPGEIFVVMGLSGSGKSTLIRHVNRLIDPTAGEIFVNGVDVMAMDAAGLRAYRRNTISMVFQRFGLLPHRSVLSNVAFGLEVRGMTHMARVKVARRWIESVGLAGYETSRPRQLSGGEQQRVGLARALAMDTPILLMDEAFSALDPLNRAQMQDELLVLQKQLRKTILFITHDFDEALKLGTRIAVLKDGAVVQVGRPEEIVLNPANDHVEAFVKNVSRARAIPIGAVMEEGQFEPYPVVLPASARCEDALPLFAANDWIGVTDENGVQFGRAGIKEVLRAVGQPQ